MSLYGTAEAAVVKESRIQAGVASESLTVLPK